MIHIDLRTIFLSYVLTDIVSLFVVVTHMPGHKQNYL